MKTQYKDFKTFNLFQQTTEKNQGMNLLSLQKNKQRNLSIQQVQTKNYYPKNTFLNENKLKTTDFQQKNYEKLEQVEIFIAKKEQQIQPQLKEENIAKQIQNENDQQGNQKKYKSFLQNHDMKAQHFLKDQKLIGQIEQNFQNQIYYITKAKQDIYENKLKQKEHWKNTFSQIQYSLQLQKNEQFSIPKYDKQLDQSFQYFRIDKKILCLDLDETLIHCNQKHFSQQKQFNQSHIPTVNIRPNCRKFLLEISNYYQIVIFTASCQNYADTIINWLDPDQKYYLSKKAQFLIDYTDKIVPQQKKDILQKIQDN